MELAKLAMKAVGAALLACAGVGQAIAAPVVYGFDSFDDSTALTTQYAGLMFTQATAIRAGLSLNDGEYPPRSADGAVFDDGGPITISFSAPVFSVGGYFTYAGGLTLAAYDINDVLLETSSAAFGANLVLSGDAGSSPNEFLQVASSGGLISHVTITSSSLGFSFVLDDLTVDAGNPIPEPSTIALMAGALCLGLRRRGWLRRS